MADGAGENVDEVELVLVREMAEIADEILNGDRQFGAFRFAAGGKRSMRAVRIVCTVDGIVTSATGRTRRYAPLPP